MDHAPVSTWGGSRRRLRAVAVTSAFLVPAPAAFAHIAITPASAPAGSRVAFSASVPNERSTADTIEVAIRLPAGFSDVAATDTPGWTGDVTAEGEFTIVTWTGGANAGRITGTDRARFRFTARVPMDPGVTITLPATQTYTSGEVDRWIGGAGSALPAPLLRVDRPRPGTPTATTPTTTTETSETTTTQAAPASDEGSGGNGALIGGGIAAGLVATGAVAFAWRRRRHTRG